MRLSWKVRRTFIVVALAVAGSLPVAARAAGLPAEEQAFFDKHISEIVQLEPTKLNDAAFLKVFATPFYSVKVLIKEADSEQTSTLIVARVDGKLVSVGRPSSDADLPDFAKMLNPDFKLKTDADAKLLQQALDAAYPIIGDSDKKAESFRHAGGQWILVRGVFFDDKLGYIFEVDASGTIKSVKFTLKLPKA